MEVVGRNVHTKGGRQVLKTLGGVLISDSQKVTAHFEVENVRLKTLEDKDVDGRHRRPYLDMNVLVSGMDIQTNDIDKVIFDKKEQQRMAYRYELNDAELKGLIDQGLYADRYFDRGLVNAFSGRVFNEDVYAKLYTIKLNHDGNAVPFVILDKVDVLSLNNADNRYDRNGFTHLFQNVLTNYDEYSNVRYENERDKMFESVEIDGLDHTASDDRRLKQLGLSEDDLFLDGDSVEQSFNEEPDADYESSVRLGESEQSLEDGSVGQTDLDQAEIVRLHNDEQLNLKKSIYEPNAAALAKAKEKEESLDFGDF